MMKNSTFVLLFWTILIVEMPSLMVENDI